MVSRKRVAADVLPLTDRDGEVGDLSRVEPLRLRPLKAMPKPLIKKLAGRRGRPLKPDAKIALNIRLSPDVLAFFKAKGKGWQTRIDQALRKAAGLPHL